METLSRGDELFPSATRNTTNSIRPAPVSNIPSEPGSLENPNIIQVKAIIYKAEPAISNPVFKGGCFNRGSLVVSRIMAIIPGGMVTANKERHEK